MAECHLRAGRPLADGPGARYEPIEADAIAKGELARAAQVRGRLKSLRPRVANLVITVPDLVNALPGLEIRLDGMKLDPSQTDSPMPLDQGLHKIEVTATGRDPLMATIEIPRDGQTSSVEVGMPKLPSALPRKPAEPPRGPVFAPKGSLVPGIVVLSAGVAALGIGTVTGALALTAASGLKSTCQGNVCPPLTQEGAGQPN